ncbi:hypothetical protein C7M84_006214 [Penaeus vannamei]|uniref:Uncharacterized protein n=1 Tax=Penaeus vannamei TaxID=6689 RepID=A0A423TFM6_PENVA|nr:hypothetical protein C7M84_006214 [Penaeus vannamei]
MLPFYTNSFHSAGQNEREHRRNDLWHEVVSEPVFVSAPDASREDDGVVLSTLVDKNNPRSVALLVLNPTTWTEIARVDFVANGTVTSTFHGLFAATNEKVHMY